MATKALRCRFGRHKWEKKWDDRKHAHIKECALCGKRITGGLPSGYGGLFSGGSTV